MKIKPKIKLIWCNEETFFQRPHVIVKNIPIVINQLNHVLQFILSEMILQSSSLECISEIDTYFCTQYNPWQTHTLQCTLGILVLFLFDMQ